jgi:hypothetical protein
MTERNDQPKVSTRDIANVAASHQDAPRPAVPGTAIHGPVPTRTTEDAAREALFPAAETDALRTRWEAIQTGFVDEPRTAVTEADALVAQTVTRLAEIFSEERTTLEKQWGQGDSISTEDLRVALRRYRSFFDRLLSV